MYTDWECIHEIVRWKTVRSAGTYVEAENNLCVLSLLKFAYVWRDICVSVQVL